MRALVVYESTYGNTHAIADAIAEGLGSEFDVAVVPVTSAEDAMKDEPDLIVVGGPTQAHGLSRPSTRRNAIEAAANPRKPLALDPDAGGPGVREWLATRHQLPRLCAAFDTRLRGPALVTGRASAAITRRLRRGGCQPVVPPESFFVDKTNRLYDGEVARARDWGLRLASGAETES